MATDAERFINLGRNIAAARKNLHLSQSELAAKLGISREHLAKIETAKRGISMGLLFKVGDTLNLPPYKLIMFD